MSYYNGHYYEEAEYDERVRNRLLDLQKQYRQRVWSLDLSIINGENIADGLNIAHGDEDDILYATLLKITGTNCFLKFMEKIGDVSPSDDCQRSYKCTTCANNQRIDAIIVHNRYYGPPISMCSKCYDRITKWKNAYEGCVGMY